MPAPTDLTWAQLNQALKKTPDDGNYITIVGPGDTFADRKMLLDLSSFLDPNQPLDSANTGVIKLFSILLEAARNAQEALNKDKPAGERLTAFPAPTTGTPASGFVPITRTLTSRARLASATEIVGTTA